MTGKEEREALVALLREWADAAQEQGDGVTLEATPNFSAEARADIKASFYMQAELLRETADALAAARGEADALTAERDEADRRAGAAERRLEYYMDAEGKRQAFYARRKRELGLDPDCSADAAWDLLKEHWDKTHSEPTP